MLLNCGVGEGSWKSIGQQGDKTSQPSRKSTLNIHWKDWCWSSNTLATWCTESLHWYWERPWYWERLRAGGKEDDRGWDGWMASPTQWTWVWVSSGSWWWTGRPGVLQSMRSQRVGHDWPTELNWTEPLPWHLLPWYSRMEWRMLNSVLRSQSSPNPQWREKGRLCLIFKMGPTFCSLFYCPHLVIFKNIPVWSVAIIIPCSSDSTSGLSEAFHGVLARRLGALGRCGDKDSP